MSRIYDAVFRNLENPSVGVSGTNVLRALDGARSDAGIHVTPETAMRFSTVYRCVALIAGTIAAMPLHTYRRGQDGHRSPYDSPLLRDPHPDQTPYELWEYLISSDLLWGNASAWKTRDASGRIAQLWPLLPSDVNIERTRPTTANPSGKVFEVIDPPSGSQRAFTRDEVFHIPALSMDGYKGLSPIQHVARQSVGIGLAAERFGARMFSRGALLQGILRTEQKLKEPDAQRLQDRWRQRTSGDSAQWDIPVLDAGATFQPIGLPPADAQYIEVRKFQVDDVARVYGIPPHLVGSVEKSTSWGSGIEQQNIGLVVYTLRQWTTRIEQRVTKELLPAGAYAKFSMDALLRGDARSRAEFYTKLRNAGAITGSEIRSLEDFEPLEGAGDLWRPKNTDTVDPSREPWNPEEDDNVDA